VTSYACYLCDSFGVRLADASNFLMLEYSRVVNNISTLKLTLPGDFNTDFIVNPDGRIEVWRKLDSGREYLDTNTIWIIKKVTQKIEASGLTSIVVEADTPLCVLREPGRFVNYAAGSAQAQYASLPADNQIKQVARENIGTSAAGSRNISAYISIDPNLGLGASVAKSFAWRDCLKVMQELADASTTSGTYVAFDIEADSPTALTFRTFTQQRGVDHRFPGGINPVLISPELGNLGEVTFSEDYRDEITYVLAGGKGDGAQRLTASSQDTTRQGLSPFGLREYFQDATQYDTSTGLSAEADAVLRNGRVKTIFQGRLIDMPDSRYGVDWAWGDYVTAQAFGRLIDCRIEAVSVSVKPGAGFERVDAWLRANS
jgi:Siphovirus ReqiPepy6 Gp37-like protein